MARKSRTQALRLTEEYRQSLLAMAGATSLEIVEILKNVPRKDIDTWLFEEVGRSFVPLVSRNYKSAALVTGRYIQQFAALDGVGIKAELGTVNLEQIQRSLDVTGPAAFKKHMEISSGSVEASMNVAAVMLQGASERLSLQGARDTLTGTVNSSVKGAASVIGYQRIGAGNSCAFCAMLLGRGPVYRSEGSVDFKTHDHCRCVGAPVILGSELLSADSVIMGNEPQLSVSGEELGQLDDLVKSDLFEANSTAGIDLQFYAMREAREWFDDAEGGTHGQTWDEYQQFGSYELQNAILRGPDSAERKALKKIWDEIFADAAVTSDENALLYRGLLKQPPVIANLKRGDVFIDNGVISTTGEVPMALDWIARQAGDSMASIPRDAVILEIRTEAGTRVVGGYDTGFEVMMKPGTKFRVVERKRRDIGNDKDVDVITLEVVK